uniref:uncharacterized protein LOC120335979 n=1 Tax=Styela clava TaxID=7725 RepID=UPI00193A9290|nr:uncharacterized protein LOC120335979 [Styela clava]
MVLIVKTIRGNTLYHRSPDGGWAWAVLVSDFFIQAITVSFLQSFGLFFIYFMEEFGTNNSQTSFISSIAMGMDIIAAPFVSALTPKLGARKIIFGSGILCCMGLLLSALASNIWMTYAGIGVLWGTGFTATYISIVAQINIYFARWRALANGVACCGCASGSMVMPVFIQYLLHSYGWRGALWICAGISLNVCVFASLVRPISAVEASQMSNYKHLQYADKSCADDENEDDVSCQVEQDRPQELAREDQIGGRRINRIFKVVKNYWILFILALSEFVSGLWYFLPLLFVVPFAKELGIPEKQAAVILSMAAVGDIVGVISVSVLLSLCRGLEKRILFVLAAMSLLQIAVCSLAASAATSASLLAFTLLHGGLCGSYITTKTTAIPVLLGVENVTKFIGWQWALSGISCFVGPPIAGHLVDIYGTYRVAYFYAIGCFITAFVLFVVAGIGVEKLGGAIPEHQHRNIEKYTSIQVHWSIRDFVKLPKHKEKWPKMVLIVKTIRGNTLYHKSPDGGWAWAVLVSDFCIQAITESFLHSFGLFFIYFMDEFGTNNTQTSLVSSIAMGMDIVVAPFVAALTPKLGARKIIFAPGISCCIGLLLSALALNIWMTYVGVGILWGAGFTASYISIVAQINIYFSRWRALANGVACCGCSIGSVVMPIFTRYLMHSYGWRGALCIWAGISLNICVFASLVRPISAVVSSQMPKYEHLHYADKSYTGDGNKDDVTSIVEQTPSQEIEKPKKTDERGIYRLLNMIKNYWILSLLAFAEFVSGAWHYLPILFVVPFAEEMGTSEEQAAVILSVDAVGDIVGVISVSVLLSLCRVLEKRILFVLAAISVLQIAACALAVFATMPASLIVFALLHGGLCGAYTTTKTTAIPVLLGVKNVTKYIGIQLVLNGISCFIGPPIAGHIVDVYGTYRVVYIYAIGCFTTAFFLFFIAGIGVEKLGGVLPEHQHRNYEQ